VNTRISRNVLILSVLYAIGSEDARGRRGFGILKDQEDFPESFRLVKGINSRSTWDGAPPPLARDLDWFSSPVNVTKDPNRDHRRVISASLFCRCSIDLPEYTIRCHVELFYHALYPPHHLHSKPSNLRNILILPVEGHQYSSADERWNRTAIYDHVRKNPEASFKKV